MNYRPRIIILTLVCCYLSGISSAFSRTVLTCLGQEELKIHRARVEGPIYKLNQLFINELASLGEIKIKKVYLKKICDSVEYAPSVSLLRILILNGAVIFDLRGQVRNANVQSYKKSLVKDLISRIPRIFFDYLHSLQSLTPTANCLQNNIKEFAFFLERFQHFEADYPITSLMQEKIKIINIFQKLKSLDGIVKICASELKKARRLKGLK